MADSTSAVQALNLVLERRRLMMNLYQFQDLDGIALKLYTRDAKTVYQGRTHHAEDLLRWLRASGGLELVIDVHQVGDDSDNERLFEWSSLRLVGAHGEIVKDGNLVTVWRRVDDTFFIEVESFTHTTDNS